MRDLEPELVVLGEDRGQGLADDVLVFHDNRSYSIFAVHWNHSTNYIDEYTKQYINSGEQLTPWGCGDLASSLLIAWHDTKQQGLAKQGMLHPVVKELWKWLSGADADVRSSQHTTYGSG